MFPDNISESICIDETVPSNGELYTIVSNRASRGGRGTIIAISKGVASDHVISVLIRIPEERRMQVISWHPKETLCYCDSYGVVVP